MSGHCLLVMARLQILILFLAVPLCTAQFRIQGPSDGNRRAQGLQYDREKGIQYDDQRASLGTGDFTIQGASDGNSDFKIQGASDGNSDFQIHGATDGNANFHIQGATDGNANFQIVGATDGHSNFQIQGASDGHSQSAIQEPYDANQHRQSVKALQYRDPSGYNVNWKQYQPTVRAQPQAQDVQYAAAPAPAPVPRRRGKARPQQYLHTEAHVAQSATASPQTAAAPAHNPYVKVYQHTPPQIQEIIQYQQQIPYMNAIPEPFRFNFGSALYAVQDGQAQVHQAQVRPGRVHQPQAHPGQVYEPHAHPGQVHQAQPHASADHSHLATPVIADDPAPQRPAHRGRVRGHPRQKRQAQGRHRQAQQPAEPQPQYKSSVPSRIQELLQYQAQIPYINPIPEKWRYETLLAQNGQELKPHFETRPPAEPVRHSQRVRQRRQAPGQHGPAQHQAQPQYQQPDDHVDLSKYQRISQPPQEPQPHYNPNLPSNLQQLLKFQSQTPYLSIIPEKYSYEKLISSPPQQHRQKRQAPQYQQQQQPHQQGVDLSQYQRISQPPVEAAPQYSTNLPASLQQLLQFQSQVPYDIIANRIMVRLDKPYVPQPVPPQQHQAQPQYQQPQQPQHGAAYQPQLAQPQYQQPQQAFTPAAQNQYQQQSPLIRPQYHPNSIPQNQPYNLAQPNNVRPVTENQY